MKTRLSFLLLGAAAAIACGTAHAQSWPSRPLRMIVPYPPGGVSDIVARTVADALGKELGQSVVVENRAGATGTIGTSGVVSATPDGYTLLLGGMTEITMSPSLYKTPPYDPTRAMIAVAPVGECAMLLVAGPRNQAASLKDLTELARGKPGSVTFGSAGTGSSNHLTAEIYSSLAGFKPLHVPYKGGGPALADVAAGHVDAMFATLPSAVPLVKAGKLRALAVTDTQRDDALPDVPTSKEGGLPDLVVTSWYGVFLPAGTPAPVVSRLRDATARAVASPDVREQMARAGIKPMKIPADGLAAVVKDDYRRWADVIHRAGISVE